MGIPLKDQLLTTQLLQPVGVVSIEIYGEQINDVFAGPIRCEAEQVNVGPEIRQQVDGLIALPGLVRLPRVPA